MYICVCVSFTYVYYVNVLFNLSMYFLVSFVRIVTIHIYYGNLITGENSYSKLSLGDLAGSEGSIGEDYSGEYVTDLLHVMKSLSAYVILAYPNLDMLLAYQA